MFSTGFTAPEIIKQNRLCVGFEVFTAVVIKSPVFWGIRLCSPLKVSRRSGYVFSIFRVEIISHARSQCESKRQAELSCWFLAWLIISTLKMEANFLRNLG
jgi:hypothetical protein